MILHLSVHNYITPGYPGFDGTGGGRGCCSGAPPTAGNQHNPATEVGGRGQPDTGPGHAGIRGLTGTEKRNHASKYCKHRYFQVWGSHVMYIVPVLLSVYVRHIHVCEPSRCGFSGSFVSTCTQRVSTIVVLKTQSKVPSHILVPFYMQLG